MLNTEKLIQLNAELEGLLHVIARRDSSDLRKVLANKYAEYKEAFDDLLASLNETDVNAEETIDDLKTVDFDLTFDVVKDEEAEESEIESENELADQAIEKETDNEEAEEIVPLEEESEPEEEVVEETIEEVEPEESPAEADEETETEETIEDDSTDEEDIHEHHSFDDEDMHEIRSSGMNATMPAPDATGGLKEGTQLHLDDLLSQKAAIDLKHAFTLNDKFCFRRTLFNQDDKKFAAALDELARQPSFEDAKKWMREKYGWDMKNPYVEDFMSIIKRHYPY